MKTIPWITITILLLVLIIGVRSDINRHEQGNFVDSFKDSVRHYKSSLNNKNEQGDTTDQLGNNPLLLDEITSRLRDFNQDSKGCNGIDCTSACEQGDSLDGYIIVKDGGALDSLAKNINMMASTNQLLELDVNNLTQTNSYLSSLLTSVNYELGQSINQTQLALNQSATISNLTLTVEQLTLLTQYLSNQTNNSQNVASLSTTIGVLSNSNANLASANVNLTFANSKCQTSNSNLTSTLLAVENSYLNVSTTLSLFTQCANAYAASVGNCTNVYCYGICNMPLNVVNCLACMTSCPTSSATQFNGCSLKAGVVLQLIGS